MTMFHDLGNATHLEVEAGARYWEDATVNGLEDTEGTLIYGRDIESKENMWRVRLNLAEGRIEGWPAEMKANIHYKVCDAGEYWLVDDAGVRLAKWRSSYVPDDFLCHGDDGYGDYIIINVGPDGVIEQYRRPEINVAEWDALPTPK